MSNCASRMGRASGFFSGSMMKPKYVRLSEADRFAIDILLEHRGDVRDGSANQAGSGVAVTRCFGRSGLHRRVKLIGVLIDMLGELPAQDPPANLVERTLRFVKKSTLVPQLNWPQNRPTEHHQSGDVPSHVVRWPAHRSLLS